MINKQKYKEIFLNELQRADANAVWQDRSGKYHLFKSYVVTNDCHVLKNGTEAKKFDRLSSAFSWCVADKMRRYDVAVEISRLDNLLTVVSDDIAVRSALQKQCKDQELSEIIDLKLAHKLKQKQEVESTLKNFFKITKTWQSRGFTDELKRSRSSISC